MVAGFLNTDSGKQPNVSCLIRYYQFFLPFSIRTGSFTVFSVRNTLTDFECLLLPIFAACVTVAVTGVLTGIPTKSTGCDLRLKGSELQFKPEHLTDANFVLGCTSFTLQRARY